MEQTDAFGWILLLALGGLAGAMGQTVRMILGIKKLSVAAATAGTAIAGRIIPSQLVVSLAIGFIAGGLAATQLIGDLTHVTAQQILALAAAGYAGADFIEGVMSRIVPAQNPVAGQPLAASRIAPAAVADTSNGVG